MGSELVEEVAKEDSNDHPHVDAHHQENRHFLVVLIEVLGSQHVAQSLVEEHVGSEDETEGEAETDEDSWGGDVF